MNHKNKTLEIRLAAAAAATSLQSCPTLCDPIEGSPPGSPIPGILQARTLEWVAISFSNAWKWKVKVKSLSCVDCSRPNELQPIRILRPWDFPGKRTGVGCHCLLWDKVWVPFNHQPQYQPLQQKVNQNSWDLEWTFPIFFSCIYIYFSNTVQIYSIPGIFLTAFQYHLIYIYFCCVSH